ncbi:hypothetical protein [Streptomyces sp. ODS28]|uniref:hypothetical protein n=1 Tax=Streptomyces sp. ODS28 TaxID=3136688 RepID=UPI0031F1BAC8
MDGAHREHGTGREHRTDPEHAEALEALEQRCVDGTEHDVKADHRLLWRELAIIAVIAALMVVRQIWLV